MIDMDYNIELAARDARHIAQGRDSYRLGHSWWSVFVPKKLILSVKQMERELDNWRKPKKTTIDRGKIFAETELAIGGWLSAALDDPAVCAEMKLDITRWFTARN